MNFLLIIQLVQDVVHELSKPNKCIVISMKQAISRWYITSYKYDI